MLIVFNRVHWCHDGIFFTCPTEHRHLLRCIECLLDFSFRSPVFFHCPVTICLLYSSFKDFVNLLLSQHIAVWCFFTAFFLFEELCLQIFHMFFYSFFGITLHARIDGRINFQTIGVDIVI